MSRGHPEDELLEDCLENIEEECDKTGPSQKQWCEMVSMIKIFRNEIDTLKRENESLRNSTPSVSSESEAHRLSGNDIKGLIDEFSPGDDEITALEWVKKLDTMREIYNWSKSQTMLYATSRLKGAARKWHSTAEIRTWDEFKEALITAFPERVNTGKIFEDIQRRKRKAGESAVDYFYTMRQKAKRIKMDDETIAKYIIAGLGNDKIASMVAGTSLNDPQELLKKIEDAEEIARAAKRYADEKPLKDKTDGEEKDSQERSRNWTSAKRRITCYSCNREGHIARNCTTSKERNPSQSQEKQKEIICYSCNGKGHIARNCEKKPTVSETKKTVRRIQSESERPDFRDITVNEEKMEAFIDTGSDVSTIRLSNAKKLDIEVKGSTQTLRGFAKGECDTLGKIEVWIGIGEIRRAAALHVVPDEMQEVPIILGLDILGKDDIRITRQGKKMKIEIVEEQRKKDGTSEK